MNNQHYEDDQMYQDNNITVDDDYDFGCDLSDVEEQGDFSPIPAGTYLMQPTSFDLCDTKDGMGKYVNARFDITDGQYAGRVLFEKFNLQNRNAQAVEIAQREIKSMLAACGIDPNQRLTLGLIRQAIGCEFAGRVVVEKDKKGKYDDQNRIKSYAQVAAAPPPAAPRGTALGTQRQAAPPVAAPRQAPPPQQQRQAAAPKGAAGGKRPWER